MLWPFATVTDLEQQRETIRRRRFGRIEISHGRLTAIRYRPWPMQASWWGVWFGRRVTHRSHPGDHCWLYFNQPWGSPDYLALPFIVSSRDACYATFREALSVLDRIAEIKRSAALVCEASNLRISHRLLQRFGWERHLEHSSRRHYIKRIDQTLPR